MILFKRAEDLAKWLAKQRMEGLTIGFVPTMGALHAGHISLIDISKRSADRTVCSIFVNPTQFNDPADFQKYPVTIEKDIDMLEEAGTDVLFLPAAAEMYPGGTASLEHYDLGRLENLLEGKYRPGHFQGVCQVMRRLLETVAPDDLFMGQKDYQQCMIVRKLLEIMGSPARLHACPILREPDGLAMSSRNLRLPASDRAKAPVIYQALTMVREGLAANAVMASAPLPGITSIDLPSPLPGFTATDLLNPPSSASTAQTLLGEARNLLEENGFRIDYIELADSQTLEPATTADTPVVLLAAAFIGEIRLIDNMLLAE